MAKYLPSRESGEVNIPKATDYSPRLKRITVLVYTHEGCVRLGNPDLDFQNLNPDFPIEREIRPQGGFPLRNPNPFFFWIPLLPFDWKIRKRVCKTILVNSGLLFTNYACACKTAVPKDSFSNPFSDFPIER